MIKSRKIAGNEDVSIEKLFGKLDDKKFYDVSIREHKDSRSIQQNKRYWALITEISSYLGYTTDEIHSMLTYKFLSYKEDMLGDEVVIVPSTTKLKIKEFNDYYTQVEQFAYGLGFKLDLEQYGY